MKQVKLNLAEIGLIAATRGLGGAGIGLLLGGKMPPQRRKSWGKRLFLIGLLTTIPLVLDVLNKRSCERQSTPG